MRARNPARAGKKIAWALSSRAIASSPSPADIRPRPNARWRSAAASAQMASSAMTTLHQPGQQIALGKAAAQQGFLARQRRIVQAQRLQTVDLRPNETFAAMVFWGL